MRIDDIAGDRALKYFTARLPGQRLQAQSRAGEYRTQCPWDGDKTPSLHLNCEKKTFHCFECKRTGGILKFEMELMEVDESTALRNIGELIGEEIFGQSRPEPDHIWPYVDETGRLLYQVLRWDNADGKKRIGQRKPRTGGGWDYHLDAGAPVRRVLFDLPSILSRAHIIITEGEKDATLVRGVLSDHTKQRVAVTTNPGGAGGWQDSFSPYITGKQVVICEDKDEPGRKRTAAIGLSLWPYTHSIKVVQAPEEYHDIGDYINAGGTEDGILNLIRDTAKQWAPPDQIAGFFVGAEDFLQIATDQPDWLVEGLIERGSNGIIVAAPKSGKSILMLHLALSLASGRQWLGFPVPRPVRVGVAAREDNPTLTARRLLRFRRAFGVEQKIADTLYINSKRQTQRLFLDSADDIGNLIQNVKIRKIDLLFLDVLNRLHGADENDNTAMRRVLDEVDRIAGETGASVCLVHHTSKADDPMSSIAACMRGASAIAGFAEFCARVDKIDRDSPIRKLRWESKGEAEVKLYYEIRNNQEERSTDLVVLPKELNDEDQEPGSERTFRRRPRFARNDG